MQKYNFYTTMQYIILCIMLKNSKTFFFHIKIKWQNRLTNGKTVNEVDEPVGKF